MAATKKMAFLQKYYVYDPGVTAGDELGNLLVRIDPDEKGNYVLASPITVQYWVDQGLVGTEPAASLSGEAKTFLAQVTRGRSEEPFERPKPLPKYSRSTQSGAPAFAGQPASMRLKKRQDRQRDRSKDGDKPRKKPEPKTAGTYGPAE